MSFRDLQDLANDTLFSETHFGEDVVYTPAGVSPTPVSIIGVPSIRSVPIDLDDGSQISSTEHQLDLRAADIVGGPQTGAKVTVRGVEYEIRNVRGPDDAGIVTLDLRLPDVP